MKPTIYLLDTNAISEAVKSRSNAGYMEWLDGSSDESMFISCLTVGEIQKGVSLASNPLQKRRLETYLAGLLEAFSGRVIDLSVEDCLLWGKLMATARKSGTVSPHIDSLIAAQAICNHLTLVTRNTKDFEQFKAIKVLSPWSEEQPGVTF